ncbi:exonuclease SbcCD subunit D [bacterium]|nr:exonuclease SbcCD subunit D [bacterium]
MDRRNETIKFVHTADWHLGLANLSKKDDSGIPIQYICVEKSAGEIVDFVHSNDIDLVLMCGDILHTRNPSPTVENILAKILHKLTSDGAIVIYLIGNHEIPGWGDNPVKIYDTLDIPGVIVADKVELHKIELKNGQKIQIGTIPYPVDFDLSDAISSFAGKVERGIPSLLMLHSFVNGAGLSGSDLKLLPDEPNLNPDEFDELPFDYIALGHIHRYQQIWGKPPAVYSGSIQKVTFAEEKERKGFVAGTISNPQSFKNEFNKNRRMSEWHFVPVESLNYITLNIDVSGENNPTEIILQKLRNRPVANSVVKLKITIRPDDPKISLVQIKKLAQELGIFVITNDRNIVDTIRGKIESAIPTGNMSADIEKYIIEKMPEHKEKIPEILNIIELLQKNEK